MEIKDKENLLNLVDEIFDIEKEYDESRLELELLKADYILLNDWQKILGKAKPTQKEKDAYVEQQLETKTRNVKKLARELKHKKMLYDVYIVDAKY